MPRVFRSVARLAAAALVFATVGSDALAAPSREDAASLERFRARLEAAPPIKRLHVKLLLSEPLREREERREMQRELRRLAREMKRKGRTTLSGRGQRIRPPQVVDEDGRLGLRPAPGPARATPPAARLAAPPSPNVRVNDPSGDFPSEAQSETSIAAFGDYMVAAWNDSKGFRDGSFQSQGWATSADGGETWTDRGAFPVPTVPVGWRWSSDPVVAVNPSTGAFYFSALGDASGINGIGVVKGRFSGTDFTWTERVTARTVDNAQAFLDKEWIAVDPASGRVYLSYTNFTAGLDRIEFQWADSSLGSWSSAQRISEPAEDGWVQGSRPIVGPGGTVYVTYYAIGFTAPFNDFMRICRSTNGGASFSTPTDAVEFFTNFMTGAPGFNRTSNIIPQFPGIAVDRSTGPHAGRLYLAWHESLNWYDDMAAAGTAGNVVESEPNDNAAGADPVAIGNTVRGVISSTSDFDYFRVSLAAGQSLLVEADSISFGLAAFVRTIAADGTTRLTLTDVSSGFIADDVGPTYIWTAPAAGDYFVRVSSKSGSGGYRFRTGFAAKGVERGGDQRDVFVAWSDNGGTSWSAPVRVDDSPAGYDGWMPEVAVGTDGRVYCAWYDWRDGATAASGGESSIYLARSADGGATWTQLGAASDTLSNWTACESYIEPNQGDYMSLFADGTTLAVCWSDARGGTPDAYLSLWPIGSTAATVTLVSATAVPGRVDLDWTVSPPEGFRAALHRTVENANTWTLLDSVTTDAGGHVTYADTTVELGTAYTYRLGVIENGGEQFRGQVTVLVPSGLRLALRGVYPNPTDGSNAFVGFTLAYATPATLEVFDLSGRLVHSQRLTGLAAATHVVPFTLWPSARSGVYVVRLTQRGESLTSRITVVR